MINLLSQLDLNRNGCYFVVAPAVTLPAFNVIEQLVVNLADRNKIVFNVLLSPFLGITQMVNAVRRLTADHTKAIVEVKPSLPYRFPSG